MVAAGVVYGSGLAADRTADAAAAAGVRALFHSLRPQAGQDRGALSAGVRHQGADRAHQPAAAGRWPQRRRVVAHHRLGQVAEHGVSVQGAAAASVTEGVPGGGGDRPRGSGKAAGRYFYHQRRIRFGHCHPQGRRARQGAVRQGSGVAHRPGQRAHSVHHSEQVQHRLEAAGVLQLVRSVDRADRRGAPQSGWRKPRAHAQGNAERGVYRLHRHAAAEAGQDHQQVRAHRARLHHAARGGGRYGDAAAI